MKKIKIDYKNPSEESIVKTVSFLKDGGLIVAPSDTCYGLLCDIRSEKAVANVYKIKERERSLPFSIAVDYNFLDRYVDISEEQERLVGEYLPGRYTLVLPSTNLVPSYINNSTDSVGVRIMKCPFVQSVILQLDSAVITTSANISGKPVKYSTSQVIEELDNLFIDLVVDAGTLEGEKPSKVVKIHRDGFEDVLRG